MENKIKFVLIGLLGATVIFVFLFIQTLSQKQLIQRERDNFKKENDSLSGNIGAMQNSIRDYENKIGLLNRDLDIALAEKNDMDRKLEIANKEKQELIERLKARAAEAKAAPQQAMAPTYTPENQDAYWAQVLKAKTDLELQLENLRSELKAIQMNYEQLQREKSGLELDINNLRLENTDSKRQLEYNQKLMDSISQELVRERNDKIQIQDSFKTVKNENKVLARQLKQLNIQKAALEKKIQGIQSEKGRIENRITEMETMLTDKITQVTRLKEELDAIRSGTAVAQPAAEENESVELPTIVVRPQPESSAGESGEVSGNILAINKDNSFVIIDLGEDRGIKVGDAFGVYRGDKNIAAIEVIQARKNISACDIKKEIEPVKIGDTVR